MNTANLVYDVIKMGRYPYDDFVVIIFPMAHKTINRSIPGFSNYFLLDQYPFTIGKDDIIYFKFHQIHYLKYQVKTNILQYYDGNNKNIYKYEYECECSIDKNEKYSPDIHLNFNISGIQICGIITPSFKNLEININYVDGSLHPTYSLIQMPFLDNNIIEAFKQPYR